MQQKETQLALSQDEVTLKQEVIIKSSLRMPKKKKRNILPLPTVEVTLHQMLTLHSSLQIKKRNTHKHCN
jgi:hypothetical protein